MEWEGGESGGKQEGGRMSWESGKKIGRRGERARDKRREKEDEKRGGVRSVGGEMEWEVKKKRKERRRRMRGKVEESKGSRKEMGEIAKGEAGGREGEESTSKTIPLQVAPESKELYPIERFTSRSISISPLLPLYLQSCQSSG